MIGPVPAACLGDVMKLGQDHRGGMEFRDVKMASEVLQFL